MSLLGLWARVSRIFFALLPVQARTGGCRSAGLVYLADRARMAILLGSYHAHVKLVSDGWSIYKDFKQTIPKTISDDIS
jgi:hypothetical protein